MNAISIIVLALALAVPATQASAAGDDDGAATFDAAMGEELYMKNCRTCHGPTAKGLASYPSLVIHPFDYLVDRLERYRAGERFGPNTLLMAPQARELSDDDIGNVAAFITSLE